MIVYEGADGWRWRLIAANGKTVADSGEAYKTKRAAVNAADRLYEIAGDVPEIEIEVNR